MKSFRNTNNILTAWGYVESNGGDIARDEPDSFNLEPGKWKLVNGAWIAVEPNPKIAIQAQIDAIEQETMVPRVTREMMLLWADDMAEREAARLTAAGTPVTKQQLLAVNSGYQKTLAVELQIKALRRLL